jgi:hypothetical protein
VLSERGIQTEVITHVLGIESGGQPEFLRLAVQTNQGPLTVRLTPSAARELAVALATHWLNSSPGKQS